MTGLPWPIEIRLKRAERRLDVTYDDGTVIALDAEYLRVESPSAEVQGHGPGQRRVVGGKSSVGIVAVEPVGNYAVRLVFDDGHDTGLYTWSYLRDLAQSRADRWPHYLRDLARAGLTRS